ncbi:polysaccharide biosynthesis protein [Parashewanella curva]|uniref:Polysaccharide biosynthesis protein n=1 Tax=Parashewanella curva TaxID=2338552 RepID=A0A3L8PYS7_9GAMM|nr:polysaccharide export protein [Parashewanella curva]RLV60380.1 polysaccharide biosynthesis protein [Parashewanella curva]
MNIHFNKVVKLMPVLLLSGCTIVPGSHISGEDSFSGNTEQLQQDLANVNVSVIDSKLIAEQRRIRKNSQALITSHKLPNTKNYEYKIGIGDVLAIGVWDHPELTIPAATQRTADFDGIRVQKDGTITYAYAAGLKAAGKTVQELHSDLVNKLSKVIEKPQVDVKVVGYKSQKVYITGEVQKPGVEAITEVPLTLVDAINAAGGLTKQADWSDVTFSRGDKSEVIRLNDFYTRGDLSQNRLLRDGDIVHINRVDQQKVFVLGDVTRSGAVDINRYGITLAQALADVGGINERSADANGIFVLRKRDIEKDGVIADVYQLHAKNAIALVLANQFQLEPQDIVYVTSAPLARWNKVISLLLPSVSAINVGADTNNKLTN